jgi:hypothetical protein
LNADIRFLRNIAFNERVRLQLIFEAFNFTNRANFTTIVTNPYNYSATTRILTPNPSFLSKTTATTDPRILQLAGKITF